MAGKQRQSSSPTSTSTGEAQAPEVGTQEVEQNRGNAAAAAQVDSSQDAAAATGLANYESALGHFLGPELYKALADALSYEKLAGYANSALDSAATGAVSALAKSAGAKSDPKAIDTLGQLVADKLEPAVDKWMAEHGQELSARLTGWTGAHPRTVAAVALLAAAGAIVANADIPTLSQKFKLGSIGSGSIDIDPGRLRAISLEKLKAKLDVASGPLLAAVEVTKDATKTEGKGKVAYDDGTKKLSLDGTVDGQGLKLFGLHGAIETNVGEVGANLTGGRDTPEIASVTLAQQDGRVIRTTDFSYEARSGVFSIGRGALEDLGGGTSVNARASAGMDGSGSVSAGMEHKDGKNSFSAGWEHLTKSNGYQLSEEDKIKLGLKYSRQDLSAQLDAAASTSGVGSAKGSVKKDLGDGWSAGGDIDARWGDKRLLEVGAFYGFRDEREFRTFLMDYRHKSGVSEDKFGLLVEQQLGSVMMRWQSSYTRSNTEESLSSTLQGAKPVDTDTSVIAGMKYDKDMLTGKQSFSPQVGVQYKGVPVVLTYTPDTKAVMIGITIPFGR